MLSLMQRSNELLTFGFRKISNEGKDALFIRQFYCRLCFCDVGSEVLLLSATAHTPNCTTN